MRNTSNQTIDDVFEKIIECIENKDSEGLKSLFSLNAVNEIYDIDKSIFELFDIYQGKMVSYRGYSNYEEAHANYGVIKKECNKLYDVETDEKKYHFAVYEIAEDTELPESEGVYTIYIVETDEFRKVVGEWITPDWKRPGIVFGSTHECPPDREFKAPITYDEWGNPSSMS